MPDLDTADLFWENGVFSWRNGGYYYARGLESAKAGQTIEAIQNFRESVRRDPDFFNAHYELISTLMDEQEPNPSKDKRVWEEIWRLCNNALATENSLPELCVRILSTRGYAEGQLGRFQEGITTMHAIIQIDPENLWAYETLQNLQFRTGDWLGSIRTLLIRRKRRSR